MANTRVSKIAKTEMSEVELTLAATKAKMAMVTPTEATKIEPGRHALCTPEVFQNGHIVAVLKDGTFAEFINGDGPTHLKRRSIRYYWTTDTKDSADGFWQRQDDYRFAKYGKVWRIHDKDTEEKLTNEYRDARAKAEEEAEAEEAEAETAASS